MTTTREQWLAERKQGIGGSDIASILGLSPWRTPVDVWLDKTGRALPQAETEAMRIGTELEDFVARRYEEATGRTVHRFNTMLHRDCLLGNIDRLVVPEDAKVASHKGEIRTDTLLECKTSSREWEDGVPLYYQTQVQHYMGLAPSIQHADVACLFLNRKHFETYRVERDEEVIAYQQLKAEEFWNRYVLGDTPPPATNEHDCKVLWARSNKGKTVEATAEVAHLIEQIKSAKASQETIKEMLAKLQSDICAYIGDAEILTDTSGQPLATWKSAKDSAKTDWESVAKAMGASEELIKQHTKVTAGSRRFLVK